MKASTLERYKAQRLSMVDNAWLHMEMPTNLMMVGSLAFYDKPLDRDHLLATLRQRLLNQPRFVQRIESSPLGPPRWVPDRLFDLNAHVHSIALPAPGGDTELRSLVGDLMSSPLDMSRPLWDAHLIENYHDGAAMLTRVHHCIADGTALVHVLLGLTSTTAAGSLRAPQRATRRRNAMRASTCHHSIRGMRSRDWWNWAPTHTRWRGCRPSGPTPPHRCVVISAGPSRSRGPHHFPWRACGRSARRRVAP